MPIVNLFKVTKTLVDLLSQNITKNVDTSLAGLLTVTPISPEKLTKTSNTSPSNTLSIFLYHVAEDPFFKNAPGPGNDVPNVARSPMALILFYLVTAHHEIDDNFDPETQQKLMGYALKTFHDFPVVTKRTQIGGTPILDPDFGNDTLQIILRPVTPEDALSFWTSEDIHTVQLSAYYEVRVVLLEPELPKSMPGVVLSLGTFLFQLGTPHLERSQSVVQFTIPLKNGGSIQRIEAAPARVTLNGSVNPPDAHNRLVLSGTNLTGGKSRQLALKSGIWANLPPPTGPVEETDVDTGLNPAWSVDFATDRVTVKLAPVLRHVKSDGTVVDLPLIPGSYTALERVIVDEKIIGNDLKRIVQSSNEVSFTVAPRIEGHDAPDAAGNIQINIGAEFDPLDGNLPRNGIQVIVAGEVYVRVSADPPANAKEFFVTNTPSNRIRIKPHFPVVVTQSEVYAFGLIVNGAESAPFWIEVNP